MRIFFFIILSFILFGCQKNQIIEIDLSEKIIIPKHYIVTKTTETILIDGTDSEIAWKKAIYSDDFIDIEGIKVPNQKTNVKLLRDENYLFVFAKIYENHIWGDIINRDEVIYFNNDFEIFINPNKHVFSYGEIEINALGTEWDLYLNKPYRLKGKADNSWDIKGLKSAININGTLNNPNDIDNYWTVEMAIPLIEISKLKRPQDYDYPKSGDVWRINFSRVNWDYELNNEKYTRKKINDKYLPEYNWVWSNQGTINMHIPENWGFLIFSDENHEHTVSEKIITEQTLYALFREISFGSLKHLKKSKKNNFIRFKEIEFNNRKISCNFLKTENGFRLEASDGNIKIYIDQSGKIKNLNYD